MIARRAAVIGLIAAAIAVVYLVTSSGAKPYEVKMTLADADGLRQGSPVAIAGQDVGNVSMTVSGGHVIVSIRVNPNDGPFGRDATAAITSVNLLGQKRVEVTKGNISDPAPSGYMLPGKQVSISTDLDQVLDVLTPDVRARLGILINEAGISMAGRKSDISAVLKEFPTDFSDLHALVSAVSNNNHTLGSLVSTTNGFVSQLASQNTALDTAIHVAGQTAGTVASRRADLTATLADAPGTLKSLDGFLLKLKTATVPLGPAARDITATAPELQAALNQVEPFTKAADPTLTEATTVAPELTSLATGATPVLKQAAPVVDQFANFAQDLTPVSGILDKSTDNLMSILQNWSRAIQFRDGLSHVFRGEASISPQTVISLIDNLEANPVEGSALAKLEDSLKGSTATSRSGASTGSSSSLASSVGSLLNGLTSGRSKSGGSRTSTSGAPAQTTAATTTSPSTSTTSTSSNSLGSLLNYLLK